MTDHVYMLTVTCQMVTPTLANATVTFGENKIISGAIEGTDRAEIETKCKKLLAMCCDQMFSIKDELLRNIPAVKDINP